MRSNLASCPSNHVPPAVAWAVPASARTTDSLSISELSTAGSTGPPGRLSRRALGHRRGPLDQGAAHGAICYIDLVDPANAGTTTAPSSRWCAGRAAGRRIRSTLDRLGIALDAGMVVRVRGEVQLYKPRGDISFIVSELDTDALLGKVAAERARLVKALVDDDLFDRNRRIDGARPSPPGSAWWPVPAPRASATSWDSWRPRGSASTSGWPRPGCRAGCAGPRWPSAIRRLQAPGCDVIVIVRGGGSKADLATFDAEPVARAIAHSDVAVWTGIGHTGDLSVADEVANRTFITPTECGQELARGRRPTGSRRSRERD